MQLKQKKSRLTEMNLMKNNWNKTHKTELNLGKKLSFSLILLSMFASI